MTEVKEVLRAGALNGESPIWWAERRRLCWIDVRAPAVHLFDPATGRDRAWQLPAWVGACAPAGRVVVLALRTGLFAFDPDDGSLGFLAAPPYDPRRFTFNDGRCDPRGRFLVGAMLAPLDPAGPGEPGMPLWSYQSGGRWRPLTPARHTSNGLAFSPDGRTLYHSDTPARTIWAWCYDPETGSTEDGRAWVRFDDLPDGSGPDGAAVDAEGFYWVAVYGAGRLLLLDPSGRIERTVTVPARCPTMPGFGGAGLETLYVTSANWSLSPDERRHHPQEGSLFAFTPPCPGLPEASWAG